MAPSFLPNFKELRRRSRASFKTDRSTDASSDGSNGATPTSGSLTPPSIAYQSDPALNDQLKDQSSSPSIPIRPPLQPPTISGGNRYSVSGMTGLGSPVSSGRGPQLPVSQYSPHIDNVADNAWVSRFPDLDLYEGINCPEAHSSPWEEDHGCFDPMAHQAQLQRTDDQQVYQKVLIVHGTIGDATQQSIDGTLTVSRLDDSFPPISWPVCDSHFKALIYMMPGANKIRFDFSSPKVANSGTSNPIHASYLTVHMLPPINAPPLQLAVLVAKDSPAVYDAVPTRTEREGNGLAMAVRKFRMAAYLWQAFTAEQMHRNRLGRRAFRFEEEWTQGTANIRDLESGVMRSEARVHVIRTDKTMAELRDLNRAQQNPKATEKDALFGIAADAVKNYFNPLPGQKQYVSVLILDSHWDPSSKVVTGHAALGGGCGDLQLAIFGSHCLQSYPASFEEVVPAFSDCTPTDANYVANDCNEAGSSWEAANIGIGAHLHETGHLFGCPHQENGIMLRDYTKFNRSFMAREAYSTRTKSKGGLVLQGDECTWHRLDCLRFRSHPCFRLPNDPPLSMDDSVQAWPVEGGNVMVTAPTGISFVEIYSEGDDLCRKWIEIAPENGRLRKHITLKDSELRDRLPEDKRRGRMRINVKSAGGGSVDVADFKQLCSKESALRIGNAITGKTAYRSQQLGLSQMEGSTPQEFVFTSASRQDRVLSRIMFYHGSALDGMEFIYDDESSQLFGKRGGKAGGDCFEMDVRRGEYITGFYLRSGFWIDGIQVLTSLGRRSPVYGNAHGGSAYGVFFHT